MNKRLVQRVRSGGPALLVIAVLMSVPTAWAQPAATPVAARPAAAAASAKAPAPAASAARAATELHVVEDDQVRIEESRVRGQLQRVTVAPKGGTLKPYEINVGAGGRDPSQDKSAAGQRVWSVLRF